MLVNDLFWWGPIVLYLVDLTIKLVALGTIPTNRRPSSSLAWLLLIFVVPILGLLIFLLIGSPFVRGRRAKIQAAANQAVVENIGRATDLPEGVTLPAGLRGLAPTQPGADRPSPASKASVMACSATKPATSRRWRRRSTRRPSGFTWSSSSCRGTTTRTSSSRHWSEPCNEGEGPFAL